MFRESQVRTALICGKLQTFTNIDNESSESATNLTNLAVENIDDEDRNRSTSIVI